MSWAWGRRLAVAYVIAEFFLTPGIGLIQNHAQASCTVSHADTQQTALSTQTSAEVNLTGGCIDNTPIGQNTPAAVSATTDISTGGITATGSLNTFGTSTSVPAHLATAQTTAPVLTSCGGGTPTITGTDTAGIVTMGTSATGCVITFNVAYTSIPYCVVTWIATPLASQSYVTAAASITLTQTSTSSNVVQYLCIGQAGG